jgi:hypothetical protein
MTMNYDDLIDFIESSTRPVDFARQTFESYAIKKPLVLKKPIEDRTIGNYVDLYVRELPQDEKILISKFVFNWNKLMGNIANFSKPVKLENKILTIETSENMVAHSLRSFKDELLEKFQEFIGKSNLIDLAINSASPY